MNADWQSIIAIAIAVLAGIWAMYMFISPFIASLKPQKPRGCAGGCGCGHENQFSKADACDSALKNVPADHAKQH